MIMVVIIQHQHQSLKSLFPLNYIVTLHSFDLSTTPRTNILQGYELIPPTVVVCGLCSSLDLDPFIMVSNICNAHFYPSNCIFQSFAIALPSGPFHLMPMLLSYPLFLDSELLLSTVTTHHNFFPPPTSTVFVPLNCHHSWPAPFVPCLVVDTFASVAAIIM